MDEVRVAKVALAAATYAIDKPYDYLAGALSERVVPGVRVLVPFGGLGAGSVPGRPGQEAQDGVRRAG